MDWSHFSLFKDKEMFFYVHVFYVFSYFQGLSASVQQHVIKPSIESELAKLLNQSVRKQNLKSPIRFEESNIHRHDVDTLSGLLGNFPLGNLNFCCLICEELCHNP